MSGDENNTDDLNIDYVNMPQNDLHQIEQIERDYESDPAKGLSHGLQKDAIQNGIGARLPGREPITYKNWIFKFKLFKINGKYALSFWDEGTTGLTGEILTDREIEQRSMEGRLTSDQNISRFLTRFDSGDNYGPGSFGRGKLIFQAASKTSTIICDSLRYDDNKYIAFDRKIEGTRLRQPRIPLQDDEAKTFIRKKTEGLLNPLAAPGTRITIIDLKDEVVESIKNSFNNPYSEEDYSSSFAKMIEEAWWEILLKFDANIYLEFDGQIKKIEVSDPLKTILTGNNDENGWKVHHKTNLPIVLDGTTYRIKDLRLVLSPHPIHEDLRGFWIQRKRMKIGYVPNITPHQTIHKKICGFVILDPELENIILQSEGITHYSYRWSGKGLRNIKQLILTHLQHFEQELGLRSTSDAQRSQQDMLDVMSNINNRSKELGLISEYSSGALNKDVEISIESFQLPNENSKRVEHDQEVGPIAYKLINKKGIGQRVKFFLVGKQKESEEKILDTKQIDLAPNAEKKVVVDSFSLDQSEFRYGESVALVTKVHNHETGSEICRISRMIWLGIEEAERTIDPFTVTVYPPLFPRARTRRVELTESISNIRFKLSNNTACDVKINADLLARKSPSPSGGVLVLKELITERNILLPAMSEKEFSLEMLIISGESFGVINEAPASADERKCDIYFSARLAENVEPLNMIQGDHIGKKKIEFYIGIDPPGQSIFKRVSDWNDSSDGKRSRYSGDRVTGYEFQLNVGHPSFKFSVELGDESKQEYVKEQMLRQAYAIAIYEREYSGIAEEFRERLENEITPAEAFLLIDEIVGKALIKMEV